jgi:hypothetical protein
VRIMVHPLREVMGSWRMEMGMLIGMGLLLTKWFIFHALVYGFKLAM